MQRVRRCRSARRSTTFPWRDGCCGGRRSPSASILGVGGVGAAGPARPDHAALALAADPVHGTCPGCGLLAAFVVASRWPPALVVAGAHRGAHGRDVHGHRDRAVGRLPRPAHELAVDRRLALVYLAAATTALGTPGATGACRRVRPLDHPTSCSVRRSWRVIALLGGYGVPLLVLGSRPRWFWPWPSMACMPGSATSWPGCTARPSSRPPSVRRSWSGSGPCTRTARSVSSQLVSGIAAVAGVADRGRRASTGSTGACPERGPGSRCVSAIAGVGGLLLRGRSA